MEFIKKIRESKNISSYRMSKELGFPSQKHYAAFEDTKQAVSMDKLIRLWRYSGLSAKAFLEMIEEEVGAKTTEELEE
ncbi:hypothetical protein NIES37_44990 [Tolypothrix tenuis PCC 7101]|uniref:XRE family transcriptional regulator n=1 Tax=Tolypothrix tenuis PCC 7101 TaxID=231146 RepID=A0A1Z4N484_9CYAN|nr:hypothetical protein [Aulosira sp. FACHB-113]BAZ00507.1 hypothetical protein NIES37_44990 [Tolypothrix tenuis PCC 7101]BAZ75571.1 hypothetical protein NIES50_41590 [Aulosira laxa NIES-50]